MYFSYTLVISSAPWEACAYNPDNQAEFIANHLGPRLHEDHPDVKLLIFDHNKDHAVAWGGNILDKNNPASAYVDGTAIHWYAGGMDRLLDGACKYLYFIQRTGHLFVLSSFLKACLLA